jgi:hypothetical protein
VLTSIFDGAGGLFDDRDREYDQGDSQGQDPGDYNDADAYDNGGFDDGGGF